MGNHPLVRRTWWTRRGAPPRDARRPLLYRLMGGEWPGAEEAGEQTRRGPLALVEAALMAADEPLSARRLATVVGLADAAEARRLVGQLRELYEKDGSAFQVEEIAGGYQLLTRPEYHPWLARLRRTGTEMRLSGAARETLTIVAYRQPITRADIEGVRGVQVGDVLNLLLDKGLVRTAGRDDSLGRPMLYATTKKFLQMYGLKSLRDLPPEGRKEEG
jgi:segregation and condensation protein B